MQPTPRAGESLSRHEGDDPGTGTDLSPIPTAGKLGGTGRTVIVPVEQDSEHGPARSLAPDSAAHDPRHHSGPATEAGLDAHAAPPGMIEAGAGSHAGAIPAVPRADSSGALSAVIDQAATAGVDDAPRLLDDGIGTHRAEISEDPGT